MQAARLAQVANLAAKAVEQFALKTRGCPGSLAAWGLGCHLDAMADGASACARIRRSDADEIAANNRGCKRPHVRSPSAEAASIRSGDCGSIDEVCHAALAPMRPVFRPSKVLMSSFFRNPPAAPDPGRCGVGSSGDFMPPAVPYN